MNRRRFLHHAGRAFAAGSLGLGWSSVSTAAIATRPTIRPRQLRITQIVIQEAHGRRLTPVAPNAYAAYRGYDVREPIVRLQTASGLEGIAHNSVKPELLRPLLGVDPFTLFEWDEDRIVGPASKHETLLAALAGTDVALLDLLGRALDRPVADLLGKRVRSQVTVYDSSLYMEDLLKPAEREGLAYHQGTPLDKPEEWVARKAEWILNQPEKVNVLKIKIGRAKWMSSFSSALERDIAVFRAVRQAVGKDVTLLVDGNDGYKTRPLSAATFAEAVGSLGLYAMEEMFPEDHLKELGEVKQRLRVADLATKLADGENFLGGLPPRLRAERFLGRQRSEPLFDIDQGDMNQSGYLRLRAGAKDGARWGMTLAPHNFGSKLGFYAMVHLGVVTPNWEFAESDDTQIPALLAKGIQVRNGLARVTGLPGLGVALKEDELEKPSLVIN